MILLRTPTHRLFVACILLFPLLSACTAFSAWEKTWQRGETPLPAPLAVEHSPVPEASEIPAGEIPVAAPQSPDTVASPLSDPGRPPVVSQGDISYENATITEDVVWSGSVLVRGYLVIASPATVRIEPGTVVRFMKSPLSRQTPRLVVMGRLHCNGTAGQPVRFTPNVARPERGDWGGILLLSSEKRNQLDHLLIEGATAGIEAGFSTLSATDVAIRRCTVGMLLRDSSASLSAATVDGCETGLELLDSEVDLRDSTLNNNQRGIVARRTTLVLLAVSLRENEQSGVTALDCRVRFTSCQLAANGGGGAHLAESEGRISGSRFVANRGVGLELVSSRLKVQGSLFTGTIGDGMRVNDGRSLVWGNSFEGNSGYNLAISGHDRIVAVGNWWGSDQESGIAAKLLDGAKDPRNGRVEFFPWLAKRPVNVP